MTLSFKYRKFKLFQYIYSISPAFIHNLIYTAYGYTKLKEAEYIYVNLAKKISGDECLTPEEISLMQLKKVKLILSHAYENTTYYKKLFDSIDFKPTEITSLDQLRIIPITNKQDILNNYQDLICKKSDNRSPQQSSTGGTTGTTLNFLLDTDTYLAREAELLVYWMRHGYIVGKHRAVMFRAGVIIPNGNKINKPWRFDYSRKLLYLSSYYASNELYNEYYQLLLDWKPKYMFALPSAAYLFAQYLIQNNRNIKLDLIFTASEMLHQLQKDTLEMAFGCPVIDHYGHGEPGLYAAGQCKYGNYHIAPRNTHVELTENGEIIETSLNNYSMPFIRYKIGDTAKALNRQGCECGLNTPYIQSLSGRESEIIYTADGRIISSIGLDQIFRGNNILLGKIIQENIGKLTILVVRASSFTESNEKALLKNLADRVGTNTIVNLNYVDQIPIEKNGKYRLIESRVPKHEF